MVSHGLKVREISVRPTTDTLREIGTVTKDSIPISFKGVQVRRLVVSVGKEIRELSDMMSANFSDFFDPLHNWN